MKKTNLITSLEQLVVEYKKKLQAQAKIDKTIASGNFAKSFTSKVTSDGFEISSTAKYAENIDKGASSRLAGKDPNIGKIIEWAKKKGLRPYKKLKNGSTRFVKLTEQSKLSMAIGISKGIKKRGTIKRYKYKGSDIFERVFESMQKKIGMEIGDAFTQDLREELITIVNKINK